MKILKKIKDSYFKSLKGEENFWVVLLGWGLFSFCLFLSFINYSPYLIKGFNEYFIYITGGESGALKGISHLLFFSLIAYILLFSIVYPMLLGVVLTRFYLGCNFRLLKILLVSALLLSCSLVYSISILLLLVVIVDSYQVYFYLSFFISISLIILTCHRFFTKISKLNNKA
jgi:hypothetical protein